MPNRRIVAAGLAAALAVTGWAPLASASQKLTVFAAASLKDALDAVGAAWKVETGKETVISYAASSALARQIEAGAPADLFISADLDWMAYLAERQLLVPGSEVQLLGNRLVLVAPADSGARLKIVPGFDLKGLVGDGKLAICDVKAVPAGKYAKAALEALGVWASVEGQLAQAENVRAALKLVSTGEAPAGIVYQTDAQAEPKVKILDVFPENSHPPIIYPAAITADSQNAGAAQFLAYLQSPAARKIFTSYGFQPLASRP